MRSSAFAVVALLAGGACASNKTATPPATGAEATASQQAAAPANRNRDLITRDEVGRGSPHLMHFRFCLHGRRSETRTVQQTDGNVCVVFIR